jgi:hypothetical protein
MHVESYNLIKEKKHRKIVYWREKIPRACNDWKKRTKRKVNE